MENKLPGSHHFFKIMKPEYMSKLPLPKAFCGKLDGQHSEMAFITTCKGIWEVNVEKSSDLLSFARGWDIFAREHDLRLGNFIVFKHIGSMQFTATIFDLTACEKDFAVDLTNKRHEVHGTVNELEMKHHKQENTSESSASDPKGRSHYTTVMKLHNVRHHFPCQYLPKAFWKAHGLHKKKSIILRDCSGHEWPIKLMICNLDRVVMGKGWSDFIKFNNLKVGDVCTFHLRKISDNCNYVSMDVSISRRQKEDCF